jgi:predicted transcriptional regulator
MKALTIKQPYASMIVNGYKKYEFRTWKTNYRGKLLIHASSNIDKNDMAYFSYLNINNYPTKQIIGECELIDCILIDEDFNNKLYNIDNKIYGRHSRVGLYAWVLSNIKIYDKYIEVPGKLGIWNYGDKNE